MSYKEHFVKACQFLFFQAQKEKQQAGGPGKGGAKKSDGGVSPI